MKLRTIGLAAAVPALFFASASANASVRPDAVGFGHASAPLATGERQSSDVSADNQFQMKKETYAVAGLAAFFAGLGLYYALRNGHHHKSPF